MRPRSILAALAALVLLATLSVSSVSASTTTKSTATSGGHQFAIFALRLTGNQEATATCAPPTVCGDPNARAKVILLVLPKSDLVCFVATWRRIDGTVNAAHIHLAPPGVPGPVVVPLFEGAFGSRDHTADCVSANGAAQAIVDNPSAYYINIHSTPNYPGGAVRAQLH